MSLFYDIKKLQVYRGLLAEIYKKAFSVGALRRTLLYLDGFGGTASRQKGGMENRKEQMEGMGRKGLAPGGKWKSRAAVGPGEKPEASERRGRRGRSPPQY